MVNGTTDGLFLDDPRFEPVLARAEALDVPIYVHPGIPPAAIRDAYYGGLKGPLPTIFARAGWGWHAETAVHIMRLVLSGALDRHPKLQLVVDVMGEDRVLLGSDHPFPLGEEAIGQLVGTHDGLSATTKAKILGGNAARWLALRDGAAI